MTNIKKENYFAESFVCSFVLGEKAKKTKQENFDLNQMLKRKKWEAVKMFEINFVRFLPNVNI